MKELVLASRSPRRARLLTGLGLVYRVVVPEVEELDAGESPVALVRENARRKWDWCRKQQPDACIIAADTVVELKGRVLGKPADRMAAETMLRAQSGQVQQVHTGYVMGHAREGMGAAFRGVETSLVRFRKLDDATIRDYLDSVQPYDRAGAYDIDESGDLLIAAYEGSRTNVMGLPVERVRQWMESN